MKFEHIPVLLSEVMDGLRIRPFGIYVDGTIGGGGHASEVLRQLQDTGMLYGFDRDEMALEASANRLCQYQNVQLTHANYKEAPEKLKEMGVEQVDGVLLDLGVSSPQIDLADRGFSILHDGRLDMRMDRSQSLDAYHVVNHYSKEDLLKILYTYGEESNAKNIVQKILEARKIKPIETTFELKALIESAFPKRIIYQKGGVSKQTFQAIRIEVNQELTGLDQCLRDFISLLAPGGRMAVITFHSLEDRIVKNVFKDAATDCICPPKTPVCICRHRASVRLVTRKPLIASAEEKERNPRSSSAKLRIIEKIG